MCIKNNKKNILLILLPITILLIGYFFYYHSDSKKFTTAEVKVEKTEIARLDMGGRDIKIISNTYSTNTNFIFQDSKTGETITTLSVTNPAISSPAYRIVKGNTHDWLVVTKIETWGTGLRYDTDEWYIIDPAGTLKMVMSYKSGGLEVFGDSGRNMYLSTDAIEGGNKYDTALDIKTTNKDCSRKEDGSDKDCRESSSISHYIWNGDKEEFVLK